MRSLLNVISFDLRMNPGMQRLVCVTSLDSVTKLLMLQCKSIEPPTPLPSERRLVLGLLSTTQETSSSGSNKTGLLTLCGVTRDGRGLTNMLVVTTTVRLEELSACTQYARLFGSLT